MSVRLCVAVAVAAMLGPLPAVSASRAPTDARRLLAEIEKRGARPVLERLWREQIHFEAVCDRIESGSAEWLEVARRLRKVSDAGSSLSLDFSVSRAIPKAPEAVLRLVGSDFQLESVCTTPFIETEFRIVDRFNKRAMAALRRVLDPALLQVRYGCLGELERLDARWAPFRPILALGLLAEQCRRSAIADLLKRRPAADGHLAEAVATALGQTVAPCPRILLEELRHAGQGSRGAVEFLGPDFVDGRRAAVKELLRRRRALQGVNVPSLRALRDEAIEAVDAAVADWRSP